MGITAIFSLIMGIFFIIFGILVINNYKLNPEKERNLIVASIPFLYGVIFIICAITGYIGLAILFLIISGIIFPRYTERKYPELKISREEYRERYKKSPYFRIMRISRYVLLGCAIFFTLFILIVVFFDITF